MKQFFNKVYGIHVGACRHLFSHHKSTFTSSYTLFRLNLVLIEIAIIIFVMLTFIFYLVIYIHTHIYVYISMCSARIFVSLILIGNVYI